MRVSNTPAIKEAADGSEWVELVKASVRSLQFGIVQIVIHNAKVVQIEKTEKVRLDQSH